MRLHLPQAMNQKYKTEKFLKETLLTINLNTMTQTQVDTRLLHLIVCQKNIDIFKVTFDFNNNSTLTCDQRKSKKKQKTERQITMNLLMLL